MRLWPRSRWRRIALLGVLATIIVSLPRWYPGLVFGVKVIVPGPSVRAAEQRTSPASTRLVTRTLPSVATAPAAGREVPRIRLVRVAELASPIAVADPKGPGPVIVATQSGPILALDLATGRSTTLTDLTSRIVSGGEQGLLGLALDPANRRLYANFTNTRGDTAIVSWPFRGGSTPSIDVAGERVHLRIGQPFANHNGGHLVFGPDGALWIGVGDGGGAGDRNGNAQRPTTVLGKMLRVVPLASGGVAVPRDNPYLARTEPRGTRPEIWGIGLRNPWRYTFDRVTHRLWVADVGQETIEEVSVIDPDALWPNFGWNILEGQNKYSGRGSRSLTDPVITYSHDDGCSITGGYVYRGETIPALYGWYVFADYCSQWIRAVPADRPTSKPSELSAGVGSVISFGELEDGELLLSTTTGLYRIMGESR